MLGTGEGEVFLLIQKTIVCGQEIKRSFGFGALFLFLTNGIPLLKGILEQDTNI